MDQITEIDEGHAPSSSIVDDKMMEEMVHIYLRNGGHKGRTQWAMSDAIHKRMQQHASVLEETQANLQRTAYNRFKTEKDKECSN
jgi:hypothetical protein